MKSNTCTARNGEDDFCGCVLQEGHEGKHDCSCGKEWETAAPTAPHYESASAAKEDAVALNAAERPEQTALPAEEMVKILFPDAFVSLSADMPTPEQAWEDAALRLADRIAACNNYEALKREVALWRSEHDPCPFSLELEALKRSHDALMEALRACQLQMLQSNNSSEYAKEANDMAISALANAKAITEGL